LNEGRETNQKEEFVYKYSNRGQGQLREAVNIEGKPYFLKYNQDKGFIQIEPKINDITPSLRPPLLQEYPYNPYEFKTADEPQKYLQRALKETPDSLLTKIKIQVKRFNEIDEKTVTLLSADILGSYFQDRFSTVHYLIIVGANGTGKSAFGDTFESIGYRAVNVTNATESFWFRLFGTFEYGQVTIIVEEFDKMDENGPTMGMLKVSYQPNAKVPRMNSDNTKMEFFYPYCFKLMIAEKSPNEDTARGVLDRSFKIKSYKGIPDYSIKEIRNPQGNSMRQELFSELMDLRKLLLMYRLVHAKDPFKEIDIGLDGRDEELCKPLLQLFYTLGASEETQREIEKALEYFLSVKNKRKNDSLEASIYPIIKNMVSPDNPSVYSAEIWNKITESLEGKIDEHNSNVWYSADFGKKYRNSITKLICDKFGAEADHKEKGNNLVFDIDKLTKIGRIYRSSSGIRTQEKTDSLTHLDDPSRRGLNESGGNSRENSLLESPTNLKENDSQNTLASRDGQDGSVNQSKSKCPYCEHEDNPFFIKVHIKLSHPDHFNDTS
jgi:hypothetical protein